MNELFIYHQTQIGDHILCYPIVRYYSERIEKVIVFAFNKGEQHLQNLGRLYSSLKGVEVLVVPNHTGALRFMQQFPQYQYLVFGHEDYREALVNQPDLRFDKYFYDTAHVPFEDKWNRFYFERNIEKEKQVYHDILGLNDGEEFIFLQEDATRNYVINRDYVTPNIKIIETAKYPEVNIFDFCYTIKRAKEVHEINSSFMTFIDMMKLRNEGLFYHKYLRPAINEQPHLKLNWKIIEH